MARITRVRTDDSLLSKGRLSLFESNGTNLLFSILGILFKSVAVLGFSVLTQKIIDTISGQHVNTVQYLIVFALSCIFCLIIGAVLEYVFWTSFRGRALAQYREHFYINIFRKDISDFNKDNTSIYTSAVTNDLNQIKDNYIESLPYVAELVFNFVGTVILMLFYDVKMAFLALAVSLLPIICSSFQMKQVEECEDKLANANSTFLGSFAESLLGFRSIKSMKAEGAISDKLRIVNKKASAAFEKREHVEISVAYIASLAGHFAQLVFFLAALFLARSGEDLSVGMIVVFVQLMQHISQLAITMPELIANIKAARKLMEKHDLMLTVNNVEGKKVSLTCRDKICLNHVSAGYDADDDVLHDLTMEFSSNGCYAIIGESGSGKTSLLNLLSGTIKDYVGTVTYDGINISDICSESLFDLLSVIHQDVFVFDASIKDNITMFREYADDTLNEVIQKAGLEELIAEKGLEYRCGENGNMLSGGERQRIAIARSIIKETAVLLLDEATSALDVHTGYQIIDTIQNMTNKTRIVVTHDIMPDLMNRFDCVFVLKDGQLAESGSFDDLILKKGVCWSLVNKMTE